MVTDLNHNTIKAAIGTLLRADTSIYDQSGGSNKLRSILVGYPPGGDPLQDTSANFAFITNNTTLESNRPVGVTVSNVIQALEHTVRYDITFVMQDETPRKTEVIMDTIQQGIMQTLTENHDLTANVDDSYPERVEALKPINTQGKTKQARKITLKCIVTTGD